LKRTLEVITKFNLKAWVIVNKFDLNTDMTDQIEEYCKKSDITMAGKLPFNPLVVDAMVNCKSITEWAPDSDLNMELTKIWNLITNG
jgi:MinD superfamily P-loop ATPase